MACKYEYRGKLYTEKDIGEVYDNLSKLQDPIKLRKDMISFLNAKGIKAEKIDAFQKRMENRDTPVTVYGIADMLNKIVKFSDTISLTEEVAHMMVDMYIDTNNSIYEQVVETDMYQKVKKDYKGVYSNEIDFRKEALGKLVKQAIIDNNKLGISGRIFKRLKGFWNRFIDFIRGDKSLETYLDEIIEMNPEKFNTNNLGNSILYELDRDSYQGTTELRGFKKQLEEAIRIKMARRNVFKKQSKKAFSKKEAFDIAKLETELANDNVTLGLVDFINMTSIEGNSIKEMLTKYVSQMDELTTEESARLLNRLESYLTAYKPLLEDLRADIDLFAITDRQKDVAEEINNLLRDIQNMENQYRKLASGLLAEKLYPFIKNSSNVEDYTDVIEMLQASDDINLYRRLLNSMVNSGDDVLGALDQYVLQAKDKARIQTLELESELLIADKELKENGIKNLDWLQEKVGDRKTHNFVTQYNQTAWQEAFDEESQRLVDKYGLEENRFMRNIFMSRFNDMKVQEWVQTPQGEAWKNSIERVNGNLRGRDLRELVWTEMVKAYKREWAEWHQRHSAARDDVDAKMIEKFEKFYKTHVFQKDHSTTKSAAIFNHVVNGTNVPANLTHEEKFVMEIYRDWLEDVRRWSSYQGEYYYIGELSRPSDMYKNRQYQEIMNNPAKWEYYKTIMRIKKDIDKHLPEEFRNEFMMPQVRKDLLQRVRQNPKNIGKEFKEGLQRQETDTQFGQLDADGNKMYIADEHDHEVKFIPVYYTNKVKDLEDLSMDITESMALYVDMGFQYKELDRIADVLEMSKEVLSKRKIRKGSNTLQRFNEFFTGKPVVKETTGGNAYDRYVEFLNMTVYGEQKADERSAVFDRLGMDQAKTIDAFNKYVSIQGLGLNLYASIASPLIGEVLLTQEKFAKEFVTQKDFDFARKEYAENLNQIMGEIGQPLSQNKMRLFGRYINVLQDHSQRLKNLDTDKNRYGKLMDTSSLFFMNHMGEHFLQFRLALAMANNIKLKDSNGNEISLYDALEVDGYNLKIKEGVKNQDGSDFTMEDLTAFGNKVQYRNQALHGIYNDHDKSVIQKYSLGRAALLFRKFIVPGWNRRFEKRRFHAGLDIEVEGMYISSFNFLAGLYKDLRENQFNFASSWGALDNVQKQNIQRTMVEASFMLATGILAAALAAWSEDDDDNWKLAMAATQANRLHTELRFYSSSSEAMKILRSPAAGIRQFETLMKYFDSIDPSGALFKDDPFIKRYKGGKNKGDTYFYVTTKKALPIINQVEKALSPEELLKFYSR